MSRLTGLVARITFAGALAAGVGAGTDANATQSSLCSLGGGKRLTTPDERNIFQLPPELVKYGQWCIEADAGVARLDAPTSSFLGTRNVITGARSDFLRNDSTDTGGIFGGSVTFGVPNIVGLAPPASVTFGGSYASFEQNSLISFADPGPNSLDIFGTGVDPFGPGFTVPPGGGTFNDLFDHRYSRDVRRIDFFGQYNVPIVATPGGITFAALARVGYTRTNIDENQSAELRNVPLQIQNNVDLGVNTFTPGGGFQIVAPVTNFFAVHLQAWAGAAFSDVSGSDNFAFSGLLNGIQHNSISGSHIGFAGGASGGISVNLGGGWAAAANVTYLTTDSHPIIVRTGQAGERSRFEIDDAQLLSLTFRAERKLDIGN